MGPRLASVHVICLLAASASALSVHAALCGALSGDAAAEVDAQGSLGSTSVELATSGMASFPLELAVMLRHTIREYLDASPMSEARMGHLLGLVRLAPSSGNMAAWHVVVVRSQPVKDALAEAAWGQSFLASSPVLLVWLADEAHSASKYAERGAFYAQEDATIAAAYFQLLATSAGLATGWVGAFDEARVGLLVGAQPGTRPIALMSCGVAAQSRERRFRRPLSALASVIPAGAAPGREGAPPERQPLLGFDGDACAQGEKYCEHPITASLREAREALAAQEAAGAAATGQAGG